MATTTFVDDRPNDSAAAHRDHAGGRAESSATTLRPLTSSATASPRGRSVENGLFGLAVVAVIAAFVASIVFLTTYEPGDPGVTTMSWPAAAAGMVGLFSAVGGYVLAFIAAVRSDSV